MIQLFNEPATDQQKQIAAAKIRAIKIGLASQKDIQFADFYSGLLFNLDLVIDDSIGTMATDGKKLFVDPWFVLGISTELKQKATQVLKESLDSGKIDKKQFQKEMKRLTYLYSPKKEQELTFVLMHECGHIMRDAWSRSEQMGLKSKQELELWNRAQDYVINLDIAVSCFKNVQNAKQTIPMLKYLCLDEKFTGLTTEQVYLKLLEEAEKKAKSQGNGNGEGCSDEESDEPLTLDEHLGGSLSDEEKERLQDIVSSAAKAAGKGNCPDEIWKKVGELKESKVNWKELLSALFSSQIISDYNYALPNKRSLWLTQFCQSKGFIGSGTSIILPTETVDGLVKADIYSDVSGSIPNSVKLKCLSEIVALTEAFGDFELTVQTWACSIFEKSKKKYDSSNSQEIINYPFIGTGGTDVYCVLNDAMNKEEQDNQDSFIIILTDGYFSQNKDDEYQELSDRIIWIVFDNPNFKSQLGTVCHYKD